MPVPHLPCWDTGHIFLFWGRHCAIYVISSWCPPGPSPNLEGHPPALVPGASIMAKGWAVGTLGSRREGAKEIPSSALQAESHNSKQAKARCQAQGDATEQGMPRCSADQPLVAQVTLAALCDLGTTADMALLAVVGGA